MRGARTAAGAALVVVAWTWSLGTGAVVAHGPIDEQITAITNRIKVDTQNPGLYLKRGELHSHHRDWDAALADYERAAQLDPTLATVDLARGTTLLEAGRYSQAKMALDRFLAQHSDHVRAVATRARVCVKLDKYREAVEDYTRAITLAERLNQPNPEYYLERARALAHEGDGHVREALRGLDAGMEKLGPIVTLQLYAIDLELTDNRYDAALARLETIVRQSPRQELWLARRGEMLEQAGRPAQARLAYQQALAAIESLPAHARRIRATVDLEGRIHAALARLSRSEYQEADP
jgi:tetratricopeptide (TPR) repeat protein